MAKAASPSGDLEALVNALSQADSLPFLFVGSGMSIRYLGHEGWKDLLAWAAQLVGKPVQYYLGQANGDLPLAASKIADDFYEVWWTSSKYAKSRAKWQDHCTIQSSPLKIEIVRHLSERTLTTDAALQAEVSQLKASQVDGIITTNYDPFLEDVFDDFVVFVGQEDLLLRRSYQLGEIYKIHGSMSQPETIVLCADDYDRFAEESPYLVAKLISVFVEHPIVFLGYSLNDQNVRTVLTSLVRALSPERVAGFKNRFIWVEYDKGRKKPIVGDHLIDLGDGHLLPVLRVRTGSYKPIFDVLAGLERVLPVGLLRRVQQSVVEIVRSADPTKRISVMDITNVKDLDDFDVVIGVGKNAAPTVSPGPKGYAAYNRHDLIDCVLLDSNEVDAAEIVNVTLPAVLKQTPNAWTPVYRFVAASGIHYDDLPARVRDAVNRTLPTSGYGVPVGAAASTIAKLVTDHGLMKALSIVVNLGPDWAKAADLRKVLAANRTANDGSDANLGTALSKATVLLDYIENNHRIIRDPKPTTAPDKTTPGTTGSSAIRAWARTNGFDVAARGPIPKAAADAFRAAHA